MCAGSGRNDGMNICGRCKPNIQAINVVSMRTGAGQTGRSWPSVKKRGGAEVEEKKRGTKSWTLRPECLHN